MSEKITNNECEEIKKATPTTQDILKEIPTYGRHKVCTHSGLVKVQDHVIECAQKGFLPKVVAPQKGWQEDAMTNKSAHLVMHAERGSGKMQPYDAEVYTPNGIVKMGDLNVGDTIFNPTGETQTVTNIFEHGMQDVYEFTMIDGSKVESGLDHLWFARIASCSINKHAYYTDSSIGFKGRVFTTKEIIEFLDKKGKAKDKDYIKKKNVIIPLCKEVEFDESLYNNNEKYIHPYLLGFLLGDGCFRQNTVKYTRIDDFISKKIEMLGYPNRKLKMEKEHSFVGCAMKMRDEIEKLGLLNLKSEDKFIPELYKMTSIKNRIEIIQGLMDADGYVDANGHMSYSTVSEKLANDIRWIIKSLGGKCTITSKMPFYRDKDGNKVQCLKAYTLYIGMKDQHKLVSLPRKVDRCKNYKYNGGRGISEFSMRITDYKHIGKKQCRCISVSHPNRLYVTNDFIVTHNTLMMLLRILPKTKNPKFSGIAYRKNKLEAEKGEGIIAKAKELFCPHFGEYKIADRKIVFKNGGELYFDYFGDSGTEDDSYDKFVARTQGGSYSDVLIDEASQAPADKMEYMQSVNRSVSGLKPQMHMACNPNPDSPLADMVMSHWADDDGNPIIENSGDKMCYFKLSDSEFIWAKSPKEMWGKAKNELIESNPKKKLTEENCHTVLKEVSFLYCDFQSNKILDTLSPNYQGSLRTGDASKDAINLYGNWAKILKTDDIITNQMMYDWFNNSPQCDDGFLGSTLDPAWGGGDYAVQCKWIGHHWDDVEFSNTVDGGALIEWIRKNLTKWGIPESRLAFDGFGANDIKGKMKESHPILYEVIQIPNRNKKEQTVKFYRNLKSQMADGFVNRLKGKGYSVNPIVLEKLFGTKTIEKALMKQKKVIKFEDEKSDGKISIVSKKVMKQILGGGESPDLIEAILYREFFDLKQTNKPLSTKAKKVLRRI